MLAYVAARKSEYGFLVFGEELQAKGWVSPVVDKCRATMGIDISLSVGREDAQA
jgi:hypothetical protein